MAKKKVKLRKDHSKKERLVGIEIDEISLVDKPAIGDGFGFCPCGASVPSAFATPIPPTSLANE